MSLKITKGKIITSSTKERVLFLPKLSLFDKNKFFRERKLLTLYQKVQWKTIRNLRLY